MSHSLRVAACALVGVVLSLSLAANAERAAGPFPIKFSHIENMTFTYRQKLEAPTQALDLASNGMLVDGLITLVDEVKLQTQATDPVTGTPLVDAEGKPVMAEVIYPAGTILNPKANPEENILLPKDVMVSAVALANGDFPIGRFGYLGVVPRFKSENLEMFASKMGHSLRVKGYVTQDLLDTYEFGLLSKFKSYSDMFAKETIHIETLRDLKAMAKAASGNMKKWYTVASYYGKHLYEDSGVDVYADPTTEAEYKRTILTAMIRTYLRDPNATVESGLALFNQYKNDPSFLAARRAQSAALFKAHFADTYVEGAPVPPIHPIAPLKPPKPLPSGVPSPIPSPSPIPPAPHADALGFVTFVYPIAIDKAGPFKLPSPGLRKFPLSSSVEGRWFSNRWLGEFGGFPFLQITYDGVAFHGPITMVNETWYLRRDNVSHSCMRMDASDLMELRALLPKNMNQLQKLGQTVPLWITEWPDVADTNNDGLHEVVDVAYYAIPTNGSAITKAENWKPSAYNKSYWTKHFSPYQKRLKSKNTFKIVSEKVVDANGAETTVNTGVFTGLPKYEVVNGVLKTVGYYTEELPIRTFSQRPTQIFQYREDGVMYGDADLDGADRWGSFSPQVVNKF